MNDEKFYTVREIATELNVPYHTVRSIIRCNFVEPAVTLGTTAGYNEWVASFVKKKIEEKRKGVAK